MAKKKKGMSREEAAQLYETLKQRMEQKYGKKGLQQLIDQEKGKASAASGGGTPTAAQRIAHAAASMAGAANAPGGANSAVGAVSSRLGQTMNIARDSFQLPRGSGFSGALLLIVACSVLKLGMTVMEATGVLSVAPASAAIASQMQPIKSYQPGFSREEMRVLTQLDARRTELEERRKKLDERGADLDRKDREFAARLTELRELTQKLAGDRVKDDRKRHAQLDQLANVYGSMNPKESAELIEQLDVTIALQLIERMPEKRIGQILSMMSPERALAITRMLSGKNAG